MGGNAFKTLLPDASFPRMPPLVYTTLKAQLFPVLREYFTHVATAPECPSKVEYGDLDFVVTGPRAGLTLEAVKDAFRATHSIIKDGDNQTSNFAIPFDAFAPVAHAWEQTASQTSTQVLLQVDVKVCTDEAQMNRELFFTSYGDVGFFLGLLAHTAGLSFSQFGLKIAGPIKSIQPMTYFLTDSFNDILTFFGLSMARWEQGFASQEDLFEWVATSPFIIPLVLRYREPGFETSTDAKDTKERGRLYARPMRNSFVDYLRTHAVRADWPLPTERGPDPALMAAPGREEEKLQAALRFFGKAEEHRELLYAGRAHERAKFLSGTSVEEWTGVKGVPIKFIMDETKARLAALPAQGGTERVLSVPAWQCALLERSDEEVHALVVTVKEELDAAGKLEYDWRAAKAAKLEAKRQKELAAGETVEGAAAAAVA